MLDGAMGALVEEVAERAAIMEIDGGLPRDEAQNRALDDLCGGKPAWIRFQVKSYLDARQAPQKRKA